MPKRKIGSAKKYKALITDLDGTAVQLGLGNMPTQRVIDAVSRLVERQIPVSIASGRNVEESAAVISALKIQEPCMLSNGAILYDPVLKKILECTPIDSETLNSIYDVVKDVAEKIVVASPQAQQYYIEGGFGKQVTGIFVEKLTKELAETYVRNLEKIPTITVHASEKSFDGHTWFISINEIHATKQRALQHILHRLKIGAEDIVAVGDGENDLPMVIAAGMGIAMGNAAEGLKSIADFIAPSVDEDGLAFVIEKFFL